MLCYDFKIAQLAIYDPQKYVLIYVYHRNRKLCAIINNVGNAFRNTMSEILQGSILSPIIGQCKNRYIYFNLKILIEIFATVTQLIFGLKSECQGIDWFQPISYQCSCSITLIFQRHKKGKLS